MLLLFLKNRELQHPEPPTRRERTRFKMFDSDDHL